MLNQSSETKPSAEQFREIAKKLPEIRSQKMN